jgi:hypothetical protein
MTLDLVPIVTAIGGLGTAASGLVDASKVFGGVNHIGFQGIRSAVRQLTDAREPANGMSQKLIVSTLESNWINGTDLGSQKATAKSLIRLNMRPGNAAALAELTGLDSGVLKAIASHLGAGTSLNPAESEVYARFDLIVTVLLDEAYQRSDQIYRNSTRALAAAVAIALALAGGYLLKINPGLSLLIGLLATPLAPIAKDVSSALSTAVNALQIYRCPPPP